MIGKPGSPLSMPNPCWTIFAQTLASKTFCAGWTWRTEPSISLRLHASELSPARKDSLYQFPFIHQCDTTYQQILDTHAGRHGMVVGRTVAHGLGIENNHIGICALLQPALEPGGRS